MSNIYEMSYYENCQDVYCGYDENNYFFIAIESNDNTTETYNQITRELEFRYNITCKVTINEVHKVGKFHILICKTLDKKHLDIFKRLISSFVLNEDYHNSDKISDLFSSFLSLFSKPLNRDYKDFEGFFTELYFILYMYKQGLNVSKYWQTKEKMKFDFNFSEVCKLDIKSTSKPNRIHHFLHEQLASEIYDIRIVSFKVRTSDQGLSINDLITRVREVLLLPLHVEKYINNYISNTVNVEELDNLKFDEPFLLDNIRFYNANSIPKFDCKQPNGVTKTEYDSDLTFAESTELTEIVNWIKNIE